MRSCQGVLPPQTKNRGWRIAARNQKKKAKKQIETKSPTREKRLIQYTHSFHRSFLLHETLIHSFSIYIHIYAFFYLEHRIIYKDQSIHSDVLMYVYESTDQRYGEEEGGSLTLRYGDVVMNSLYVLYVCM